MINRWQDSVKDLRRLPRAGWQRLSLFERWIALLLLIWALSILSLPILKWVMGAPVLPVGISIGVLFQLVAVRAIIVWTWGAWRANRLTLVMIAMTWGVEYVGHTTGLPFGAYHYTDQLQPQIGGVPVLIPLAWLTLLPSAWAVAQRITRGWAHPRLAFVVVSALAFTAWDLFLDPQMVNWLLWVWDAPGGYFGIPLSNFAGWLLASAAITALASILAPLDRLPARPLIAIYAITWALETIGLLLFWGLPGAALVGGAAMGSMLLWSLRR